MYANIRLISIKSAPIKTDCIGAPSTKHKQKLIKIKPIDITGTYT